MTRQNLVELPPVGFAIAIQYWEGDEVPAMRLARLIADIEPEPRVDVTLVLARRYDTPLSRYAWDTSVYCGRKFTTMMVRSAREATGHPDGCFALWAGTMDFLTNRWAAAEISFDSVFTVEADGCPVAADWIERLRAEHRRTLDAGRRITGVVMDKGIRHVNGTLVAHLSIWPDRQSIHATPASQAWDLFHAQALLGEARHTSMILNAYGAKDATPGLLRSLQYGTVWLSNAKDDSVIRWAEAELKPVSCTCCSRRTRPPSPGIDDIRSGLCNHCLVSKCDPGRDPRHADER